MSTPAKEPHVNYGHMQVMFYSVTKKCWVVASFGGVVTSKTSWTTKNDDGRKVSMKAIKPMQIKQDACTMRKRIKKSLIFSLTI
jgi:hypothetical protein